MGVTEIHAPGVPASFWYGCFLLTELQLCGQQASKRAPARTRNKKRALGFRVFGFVVLRFRAKKGPTVRKKTTRPTPPPLPAHTWRLSPTGSKSSVGLWGLGKVKGLGDAEIKKLKAATLASLGCRVQGSGFRA